MEKRILMKKWLISVILILVAFANQAQDVDHLLRKAKQSEASMNDLEALQYYRLALGQQPLNVVILCKCSELSSRIAARSTNNIKTMTAYHQAAKAYAVKVLQVNPLNSEANFVMALVEGRDALIKSGKQKIDAVKDIEKFARLAIRYDVGNYKAWHVMGKWYYEISALNIFERSAVKLFFDAVHMATFNVAIIIFDCS